MYFGHFRNSYCPSAVFDRNYQFRIAEEEAIKSDEDLTIRGRRQARKNKLILNMIKETDAYLARETVRDGIGVERSVE